MEINYQNISQTQLKKWAKLSDVKVRREEGIFLAEGVKVVQELIASTYQIKALLLMPEKTTHRENFKFHPSQNVPVYQLTRSQWQKIGQDREPEGIMAVVSIKQPPDTTAWLPQTPGNILILHEINNPRNLGAIMRSAHWFGFSGIIISTNSADYTNPKAVRASMGSLFHLTIIPEIDLSVVLSEIKKHFFLVGSDVREGLEPHPVIKKTALLLGNESHGLPPSLLKTAHEQWSIPGRSKVDSLSLAQAAAIMMYECTKK